MRSFRNGSRSQIAWMLLGFALVIAGSIDSARAERVKDLATFGGVRSNQLVGYGLVVGLDGTGDRTTQAPFTTQTLVNMLERLGITLPKGINHFPSGNTETAGPRPV